jgi:hypothetical protein
MQAGIQISQRIAGGEDAEIESKGEDQLNQARARFAQLEHGAPEHVGKDKTHEVEVL